MNTFRMMLRFVLLLSIPCILVCSFGNGALTGNDTGTGSETIGLVYTSDTGFAAGALVRLINANDIALPNTNVPVDSIYTDSAGQYSLRSLAEGNYNIFGEKNGELSFRGNIHVKNGYTGVDTLRDTLNAPGSLLGVVKHRYDPDSRYILVLMPGTNRYSTPDDMNGAFRLTNFARGAYKVRFLSVLTGYIPLDTDFAVRSGKTDTLSDTIFLEYNGILPVTGLSVSCDTMFQIVNLSWNKIEASLVSGYNVMRAEAGQNFTLITQSPVTDTFYADSNVSSGKTYSYKVAGYKDGSTGPFSEAKTVEVKGLYDSIGVFGGLGSGNGQFENIGGMAYTKDSLVLICDGINNRIQVFDFNGTFVTSFGNVGNDSVKVKCPNDIAVGSDLNIYIVEYENNRVHKFDPSFNHIKTWGKEGTAYGEFRYPLSITVDANNCVYVIDDANKRIQKFDSSGAFIDTIGAYGTGVGCFLNPRVIRCSMKGLIFITDGDINKAIAYDTSGAYVSCSTIKIDNPFALAVDLNTDNLYIAEYQSGKIFGIDSDGDILFRWYINYGDVNAILVLTNKNVWIARNNRIYIFAKK